MKAETTVAVVAASIALAAAVATFWQVREARAQTALQRQIRIDSAQPYVYADFRVDLIQGALITVHLENRGPTVATNVRLTWQPELPGKHTVGGTTGDPSLPPRVLPSMPPGRVMIWTLGVAEKLLNDDTVPRDYLVTVKADGPFGPVEPLTYTLSLDDMHHTLAVPIGSLHKIERAIATSGKALDRIASAQDRLARIAADEADGGGPTHVP
ncbi:hypothetical protein [Blastococcus sp. SYSU DS0541]